VKRRVAVGGAVVVLAGVLAALAWWWFPHWRPALRNGERYGIDVSAHQGTVDWRRVAADGIEFAYVKATEGGDFRDDRFAENWSGAQQAGLDRGAYHFFTLCTPGAPQAANFLSLAPPDPAALAPAVDLELAGNCRARPARTAVVAELDAFLAAVEAAWGRQVVIYLGDDFEGRYEVREALDRPLWLRRFLLRPRGAGVTIWQVHGYAKVDGITGRVDLNLMKSQASRRNRSSRVSLRTTTLASPPATNTTGGRGTLL
jgi:lysozyme